MTDRKPVLPLVLADLSTRAAADTDPTLTVVTRSQALQKTYGQLLDAAICLRREMAASDEQLRLEWARYRRSMRTVDGLKAKLSHYTDRSHRLINGDCGFIAFCLCLVAGLIGTIAVVSAAHGSVALACVCSATVGWLVGSVVGLLSSVRRATHDLATSQRLLEVEERRWDRRGDAS